MKKPKLIRALDVDAVKWYMARAYVNSKDITWQPCKVVCTKEPGWERGHVELNFETRWPRAAVKFAGTRVLAPHRETAFIFTSRNQNNEWVFMDSAKQPTLIELDVSMLERAMRKLSTDIIELETRRANIQSILDEIQ